MNMEIYAPRRFPLAASCCTAAAIVLLCLGAATANPHWCISAVAPALLSAGLMAGHRRAFHAVLTDEGLEVERPAVKIPLMK
jgi:hypothetical protein